MRTSVLHTVLAVALVVGTACKGPDSIADNTDLNSAVVRGANVVGSTDTLARASATFNTSTGAYSYSVAVAPAAGTIDSIALYQVGAATAALPANATAIFCAGAAACAATSGTATTVGTATLASIKTSIRAYGTQLVFFTTGGTAPVAKMRGTVYPAAQ